MLGETPRTASGATILDLHSIRAGLDQAAAELDQGEALRRQRVGRIAAKVAEAGLAVGDVVKNVATGDLGSVLELTAAGRVILQFEGRRLSVELRQIALGVTDTVDLPSDCEAAS